MAVDKVVALQLGGEARRGVGELKVVVGSPVGPKVRIAEQGFHRVHFDGGVADEGDLRHVLRCFKVVFQFQMLGHGIRKAEFWAKKPEIVLCVGLSVVAATCTDPCHIAEFAEAAFQLRKQVELRRVHLVDGLGVAVVFVAAVALAELESAGKREGFESVFIDGFAPKRVGFSFCIVLIIRAFVSFCMRVCLDEGAHEVGRERLVPTEIVMIIKVERWRATVRGRVAVERSSVQGHRRSGLLWTKATTARELRLKNVVGIAQAVGQLGVVAQIFVLLGEQMSIQNHRFPRFQRVNSLFVVFRALEILVVKAVVEAEFALFVVDFSINRLVAIHGGQCVRQLRADDIAADGLFHLENDDISRFFAVAQARIVDKFDALDGFHIKRKQVFACGHDVVDAHLHRTEVAECRDAVHRLIDADVGQCEFRQERIAVG